MEEFQYCRACLASDVKMYSLDDGENFCTSSGVELKSDITMGSIYSQVVQIPEAHGTQYLCFHCVALLDKFHRFKSRCHQVHDILHKLETAGLLNESTSEKIIKSIDRKLNNLETHLQLSPIEILSFDPLNYSQEVAAYELKPNNKDTSREEFNKCIIDGEYTLNVDQSSNHGVDAPSKVIVNELLEKDNQDKELLETDNCLTIKNENADDPLQEIDDDLIKNDGDYDMSDNYEDVLINNDEDSDKNELKDNCEVARKSLDHDNHGNKNDVTNNPEESGILLGNKEHGNKNDFADNDEDGYYILVKNADDDSANNSDTSECNPKKRRVSVTSDCDYFAREYKELSLDKLDMYEWYNGSEITVTYLSLEEAKKRMLLRKNNKTYTMPEFKCNTCYMGFKTKIKLDCHMEKHNEAHGKFECNLCHLRYPTRILFRKHLLTSHMRKYACNLCPFHCFTSVEATRHISSHKKTEYPCSHCSETFSELVSLSTHMKRSHPEKVKESVCEFCGKGLASLKGLIVHKRKIHKQTAKKLLGPKCEECNIQFATKKAWEQHFARSSNHGGRLCVRCGEIFETEEKLKEHSKEHPFKGRLVRYCKCDVCGIYLRAHDFEPHVTTVHVEEAKNLMKKFEEKRKELNKGKRSQKKDVVCEFCGKLFLNSYVLAIHKRSHTGERPYKCQLCDEAFATTWKLKGHMIVHSEDGAWKCDTCGKPFTTYQIREKHVKTVHLKSRPHKCPTCGKRFPYVCALREHIKYIHDKVPWPKRIRNRKNGDSSKTGAKEEQ